MSIRHWPTAEQPATKLLMKGPDSLSDSELLSLLIRTGLPGKHAVDIARDALTTFGSFRALLNADIKDFCAVKGLGESKYVQLQASLEMTRRYLFEKMASRPVLGSPKDTRDFLALKIGHLPNEVFLVIFLDAQNQLLAYEQLFEGSLDGCSIFCRNILERVLHHRAKNIIACHQHPSEITLPSHADRVITDRIKDALAYIDAKIIDHIIIGGNDSLSFAEKGWL